MSAPRAAAQLPRMPVSFGYSFRPLLRGRGRAVRHPYHHAKKILHAVAVHWNIWPPLWLAPDFRLALERWTWLIGTANWQMHWASVAQLDRASDFGSEGCRFESCPTRQIINGLQKPPFSTTLRVVPF